MRAPRYKSFAKALGNFVGGQLTYWPSDNGECSLRDLREAESATFDTRRQVVIFDGCRCHCVQPFTGERYSLVFFTTADYQKAQSSDITFLLDCGITWPTEVLLNHYINQLGPARGKCLSIRQCFGYAEKSGALQISGTPLASLSEEVLRCILQHHLDPLNMAISCALSARLKHFCYDRDSWQGSIVDVRHTRPAGHKAHLHFKLWEKAFAVISGPWCHANVSLLMSKTFTPWKWVQKKGSPFSKSCGKQVCASQSPVPRTMTIKVGAEVGNACIGLCTAREAGIITQCVAKGSKKHLFLGLLFDSSDDTATMINNNEEMPEAAFVSNIAQKILTISFDDEHLRASLGNNRACVFPGQRLDGRSLYTAAIVDKKCELDPCWAIV